MDRHIPAIDQIREVQQTLQNLDHLSHSELTAICTAFGRLSVEFERRLSNRLTNGEAFSIELRRGLQNKQFMIDLMPRIQAWLGTLPIDSRLDVLDVGPSWGLGTRLLASLYKRPYLGYQLDITAIDIRNNYLPYVRAFCPYVKYLIQDLFSLKKSFDVVICSHVIEHVEGAENFVHQLIKTARKKVFLCAPYREQEPLATDHINVFDDKFLSRLGAEKVEIVGSPAWGARAKQQKQMFIAEIPGKA